MPEQPPMLDDLELYRRMLVIRRTEEKLLQPGRAALSFRAWSSTPR